MLICVVFVCSLLLIHILHFFRILLYATLFLLISVMLVIHVLGVIHVAKYDAHCDIFITCLSYYLENRKLIRPENRVLHPVYTIGYHRNYSGRWLVATMSASKSTSLMRDFTSLQELDLMSMSAVKSYLHS